MTQSELKILRSIVRTEPFRGAFCGAYGNRDIGAAQDLQSAGLARIIMLDDRDGEKRYAVIPPNREWDYANSTIRP